MRPTFRRFAELPKPPPFKLKDRRLFGFKRFPGKVVEPMAPFFVAALIMIYAIDVGAKKMMETDEWKDDPRNPNISVRKAKKQKDTDEAV